MAPDAAPPASTTGTTPQGSAPTLPDTTGLYALGGLSTLVFAITGLLFFFYQSPNPFVQTILLPHFHRFGWWGEVCLLVLGVYAGARHVDRLQLRHRVLRGAFLFLLVANLWAQWELHRLWLSF